MEALALLVIRVPLGTFFALSGFHKLFFKQRHAELVATLKDNGVYNRFTEWAVCAVEFSAGCAVACGLLTQLAAFGLLVIICTAICTDCMKRMRQITPLDPSDWLLDFLYLPEVLYAIMLVAVLLVGGGPYSLDHWVLSWV